MARAAAGVESVEIERKYEVEVGTVLPTDFSSAGLTAGDPERIELRAIYFDTADGNLAARLVVVRRREGGGDEGWHLKAKGEHGARELHWPLAEEMPEGLREEIARLTDQPVMPLAELRTTRTVLRLRDDRGTEVIEIADDRVLAEHYATGVRRAWREWEAELLSGADSAQHGSASVVRGGRLDPLDAIEPMLLAAGATRSTNPAKIVRATGLMQETDTRDRAAARRLES